MDKFFWLTIQTSVAIIMSSLKLTIEECDKPNNKKLKKLNNDLYKIYADLYDQKED